MRGLKSFIILQLVYVSTCMDQLDILYEWKELDFDFPTPEARQLALENRTFIPQNIMPMGLEAYGDKLFITTPRWRAGVPSTLNYINLNDNSTKSPKLIPYPSWAAHPLDGETKPDIISTYRVRVDRCNRLWVPDSGKSGTLENVTEKYPPALIVYDLKTNDMIRRYTIPADQVKEDSGFANVAIEDIDCENTYAYIADVGKGGLVVYSWAKNESWRISHNYFYQDPLACDFKFNGLNFTWTDAIFGVSLSAPNADNYSTLYFHPMASFNEFSVSTEYLRNESLAKNNFNAFKLLGTRGPNAQSSASFLDQKTGVLFYSLVNLNAVACWRTTNKQYTMQNQGRIFMSNETMVYPTDIKVDHNDTLWVLSNRMPFWMYGTLDPNEVNFRVFSAPVLQAISHTTCDIKARSDILEKHNITNKGIIISTTKVQKDAAGVDAPLSLIVLFMCSIFAYAL